MYGSEILLANTDSGKANRTVIFASPAHRTLLQVVDKMIIILADIAALVAELVKGFGHGFQANFEFGTRGQYLESQICHTGGRPKFR